VEKNPFLLFAKACNKKNKNTKELKKQTQRRKSQEKKNIAIG